MTPGDMKDVSAQSHSVEDRWFAEHEKKLLEDLRRKREDRSLEESESARADLKEAHWLKCCKCGHDMETIAMQKLQVDRCTSCGGLYFDAGELEMLLDSPGDLRKGFFKRMLGL